MCFCVVISRASLESKPVLCGEPQGQHRGSLQGDHFMHRQQHWGMLKRLFLTGQTAFPTPCLCDLPTPVRCSIFSCQKFCSAQKKFFLLHCNSKIKLSRKNSHCVPVLYLPFAQMNVNVNVLYSAVPC